MVLGFKRQRTSGLLIYFDINVPSCHRNEYIFKERWKLMP